MFRTPCCNDPGDDSRLDPGDALLRRVVENYMRAMGTFEIALPELGFYDVMRKDLAPKFLEISEEPHQCWKIPEWPRYRQDHLMNPIPRPISPIPAHSGPGCREIPVTGDILAAAGISPVH